MKIEKSSFFCVVAGFMLSLCGVAKTQDYNWTEVASSPSEIGREWRVKLPQTEAVEE